MVSRIRVLLLMIVMCSTFIAAENPPHVTLSVYNDSEVPGGVLTAAREHAVRILGRAGVDLIWRDCAGERREACGQVDGVASFSLRIVPKALKLKSEVFGIAFLGEDGRGAQADVFLDRIREFASRNRVGVDEILGHVVAHELGHLLLGSNAHATMGIMRSRWEEEEVKRVSRGTLYFDKLETEKMHRRLDATDESDVARAAVRLGP